MQIGDKVIYRRPDGTESEPGRVAAVSPDGTAVRVE